MKSRFENFREKLLTATLSDVSKGDTVQSPNDSSNKPSRNEPFTFSARSSTFPVFYRSLGIFSWEKEFLSEEVVCSFSYFTFTFTFNFHFIFFETLDHGFSFFGINGELHIFIGRFFT